MIQTRCILVLVAFWIAPFVGGCDLLGGDDVTTFKGPGGPAVLTGRIALSNGEAPSGAEVTVYASNDYNTPLAQGRVKETGRFRVTGLPVTAVDVVVIRDGFFADKEVEIVLHEGTTALNDGEPISLASTARSSGDGRPRYAPCQVIHSFKQGVSTERAREIAAGLGESVDQVSDRPFGVDVSVYTPCGEKRSMVEVMSRLIEHGNRTQQIKLSHPSWLFYLQ